MGYAWFMVLSLISRTFLFLPTLILSPTHLLILHQFDFDNHQRFLFTYVYVCSHKAVKHEIGSQLETWGLQSGSRNILRAPITFPPPCWTEPSLCCYLSMPPPFLKIFSTDIHLFYFNMKSSSSSVMHLLKRIIIIQGWPLTYPILFTLVSTLHILL